MLINGGSASASEIVAGALRSPQGKHRRNAVLRQGLRPDYYPARIEWCAPTNHRSLFHAVGALDPGQGLEPDAVVEEDLPEKLKKAAVSGESEANLRGHLRGDGEVDGQEESGSSSYVPEGKGTRIINSSLASISCAA